MTLHWDPRSPSFQLPPAVQPFDHHAPTHGPHVPESGSYSLARVSHVSTHGAPLVGMWRSSAPLHYLRPFMASPNIPWQASLARVGQSARSSSTPSPLLPMLLFFAHRFFLCFFVMYFPYVMLLCSFHLSLNRLDFRLCVHVRYLFSACWVSF